MPKMNVTRSVSIKSTPEELHQFLSNFNEWTKWSPWLIMEPEAVVKVQDDNKSYSWEGNRVGSGNMKILAEEQNKSIDYELNFLKPWKSTATVRFDFQPDGDSTKVTWSMDSSLPFFLFWMKKMMEAFVGMDYERGLSMMKDYMETGTVPSSLAFKGRSTFNGCNYIGVQQTTDIDQLGPQMEKDFTKLGEYSSANEDNVDGEPFTIYHKWDMVKRKASYSACIPVKSVPADLPSGTISGKIPTTEIYTVAHTGPYRHLGNAWSTLYNMERSKEFKSNKKIHPFEVYVNEPGKVADNELITLVNFPVR